VSVGGKSLDDDIAVALTIYVMLAPSGDGSLDRHD